MCTILLAWGCVPASDIVLAANRDEFFGRAVTGPCVLVEWPRIVGGQDVVSGGTWLAIAADGRIAAVTNRLCDGVDPSRRSRGELPLAMLEVGASSSVRELLVDLDPSLYNPFNALYVARDGAMVGHAEGSGRTRVTDLEPGLHVLTLCDVDEASDAKVAFLARQLEAASREFADGAMLLSAMETLLAEHGDDHRTDLACTCVHGDGYGTVSSSAVALAHDGRLTYRYADGPPCRAPWRDVSDLVI